MGPSAVEIVKRAIGRRDSGYVFINPETGTRYSTISESFSRAAQKLRVGDTCLRFHDLRHVFATWLHAEGVSLDTLRVLMNHKKRSMTDRYMTAKTSGAANVLMLMPKQPHGSEENGTDTKRPLTTCVLRHIAFHDIKKALGAKALNMVGDTGIEPVTSCMSSRHSNHLS